eukprot:SAG31_NODE_3400_length_4314_cov_2.906762_4_plen_127_part_00
MEGVRVRPTTQNTTAVPYSTSSVQRPSAAADRALYSPTVVRASSPPLPRFFCRRRRNGHPAGRWRPGRHPRRQGLAAVRHAQGPVAQEQLQEEGRLARSEAEHPRADQAAQEAQLHGLGLRRELRR